MERLVSQVASFVCRRCMCGQSSSPHYFFPLRCLKRANPARGVSMPAGASTGETRTGVTGDSHSRSPAGTSITARPGFISEWSLLPHTTMVAVFAPICQTTLCEHLWCVCICRGDGFAADDASVAQGSNQGVRAERARERKGRNIRHIAQA